MPWPAVAHDNIDMKKTRTLITLGLLLGLAGSITGSARAEQETTPTTPATPQQNTPATTTPATKPAEQVLKGRIVAVGKSSITLQVDGQTYVLNTAEDTKFNIAGQQKSLSDLVVGEEVNVTVALRETPGGRPTIAVVSVESAGADAQDRDGHGRGRGRGFEGHHPPPFVNLPNPANVGGHSRSPHR